MILALIRPQARSWYSRPHTISFHCLSYISELYFIRGTYRVVVPTTPSFYISLLPTEQIIRAIVIFTFNISTIIELHVRCVTLKVPGAAILLGEHSSPIQSHIASFLDQNILDQANHIARFAAEPCTQPLPTNKSLAPAQTRVCFLSSSTDSREVLAPEYRASETEGAVGDIIHRTSLSFSGCSVALKVC